jgi:hypothetical protein
MLSSTTGELVARFLIGGTIVSIFAAVAEIVRPKSFAGLFGAAPSIALATFGISIAQHGSAYATTQARSMVFGALAFFCYAAAASWMLVCYKTRALTTTVGLLPVWLGFSLALWFFTSR